MNKLIVILGPTASGKTSLSIKLAKKFNGEVVSADSRQVYKGMDIGTAKPLQNQKLKIHPVIRQSAPSNDGTNPKYIVDQVVHWMINIKNPNQPYTVAEYKKDAIGAIRNIQKRNKLAILAGGTGLYIKSVIENLDIPKVKANPLLRHKIEKEMQERGLDYVFQKLIELDPEAAYIVDPKNPRRVVRALEVVLLTKRPFSEQRKAGSPLFNILEIGVSLPKEKLKKRINFRVNEMIKEGLVKEVKELIKKYGREQRAFDAIGYREIIEFLNNKTTLEQAVEIMKINTWHYAKRQMTWFKKDQQICWIKNQKQAEKLVKNFVT